MFNKISKYQIVFRIIRLCKCQYPRKLSLIKKFDKCVQDICENNQYKITKFDLNDMESRNNESLKFADKLKSQGHTCIQYLESYPVQIRWCGQDKCVN